MSVEGDLIDVRLIGLSLPVRARFVRHNEGLLRELALIRIGEQQGPDASLPQRLLQIASELSTIYAPFQAPPEAAMDAAAAAGQDFCDVTYTLPPAAVPIVTHIRDVLEEADAFCRAQQHLLTLPAPQEVVAYRHWLFEEILRQLNGLSPRPWHISETGDSTDTRASTDSGDSISSTSRTNSTHDDPRPAKTPPAASAAPRKGVISEASAAATGQLSSDATSRISDGASGMASGKASGGANADVPHDAAGTAAGEVVGEVAGDAVGTPLMLNPEANAVAEARRYVRQALTYLDAQELEEAAELAVSELVTNAMLHARTAFHVTVRSLPSGRVRVEVSDSSALPVQQRHLGMSATTGRGLRLVHAVSTAWGIDPAPAGEAGKTVWFEPRPSSEQTSEHDLFTTAMFSAELLTTGDWALDIDTLR